MARINGQWLHGIHIRRNQLHLDRELRWTTYCTVVQWLTLKDVLSTAQFQRTPPCSLNGGIPWSRAVHSLCECIW